MGLPSEYDYWLREYSPNIPLKSITTNCYLLLFCSTEYQSECETLQEEHDVEDDVVSCETVLEEKCEDETSGYTTNTKCSKWPKEVCNVQRTPVKKYTPETRCQKVPVELCGPSGKS